MRYSMPPQRLFALLALLALVAMLPVRASSQIQNRPDDILVVANKGVPTTKLSVDDVRAMFLKRKVTWDGDLPVVPVHPNAASPLRAEFLKRVIQLSAADETRYWEDQKIKHGIIGPKVFPNPLKAVYMIKGSLSYIQRKDYKDGVVKIVLVLPAAE